MTTKHNNKAIIITGITLLSFRAMAGTLYWDGDGDPTGNNVDGTGLGGPGSWSGAGRWWNGLDATNQNWVAGSDAVFSRIGGTVVVGPPDGTAGTTTSAGNIHFAATGYTLHMGTHTSANELSATSLSGSAATITSAGTGANGRFVLANPAAVTWNGTISSGYFGKTGAGTLNFTGTINVPGTYGSMSFQGGTNNITGTTVLGGPGFYTSNLGTVVNLNNNSAGNRVVSIGYGSEVTTAGSARLKQTSQYDTLTSYGLLSGTLGLEFADNGSATFNVYGANSYSGGTYFTSTRNGTFTLNVHHDTALGSGRVAMTSNTSGQNAIVKLLSPTPAIGSLESSGNGTKSVVVGNAVSSGLQGKWTSGANLITLSAANAYQLAVGQTIPGSAANGLPANAVITEIKGDTTFLISVNATITKSANTSFTAAAVNATLTVGALNRTSDTFGGAISQALGTTGSVTKVGTGEWILSGANTYTGTTRVENGKLTLTGSLGSGKVQVAGGTFEGGTSGTRTIAFNLGSSPDSMVLTSGTLDISNINLSFAGTATEKIYTLVDYSAGGTFAGASNVATADSFASAANIPANYKIRHDTTSKLVTLQFISPATMITIF